MNGQVETHPARGVLFAIPDGYRLLVGRDISDATAFRDRIKATLMWAGLIALGIGLLGGTVMSRNMLRRVEQVNRTAERVMAGNLSDRVPRPAPTTNSTSSPPISTACSTRSSG